MTRFVGRFAVLACAASLAAPGAGQAAPSLVDPGLGVRTVASGLVTPTGMAFLPSGEMLVLEKNTGKVQRVVDGAVVGTALDLSVNSASERGLLGVALDPDFAVNQFVYLYWTQSSTGADSGDVDQVPLLGNRVDRFVWTGSALVFDRNLIQLRAVQADSGQPARGNHNGGVIRFGPDGKLYVLVGDVGAAWAAAEPRRRSLRAGYAGRCVRRPRARQRSPDRGNPASEPGRFDPDRQPVLRGRRRNRRRGRRQRPAPLRLRDPQQLRDRLRPALGRPVGAGERG